MKIYNNLYNGFEQLRLWINDKSLNLESQSLVSIHTDILTKDECVALAKYIKELLPNAIVNGCSVSGIIYNGEILENETLVSIYEFEYGKVYSKIQSTFGLSSEQVAESLAQCAKVFPTNFGTLIFDFSRDDIYEITEKLNTLLPDVQFVGGLAGKMQANGDTNSFVFDETGFYVHSYLVNFIDNSRVLSYSDIITGHPPVSDVFTITKVDGECIEEIDTIPALDWLNNTLGLKEYINNHDKDNEDPFDILLRFPLVLEGYTSSTRFVRYNKEHNALQLYATQLPAGMKFRLGYLSHLKSAEELQIICHNLQMLSAEMIFCYSCSFRKLFSDDIAQWELRAFAKNHVCGAFMLGEIGTKNNQVQFLNGSACIFTLAERAVHIEPDLSVFDSIASPSEEDCFLSHLRKVSENIHANIFASSYAYEQKIKNLFSHKSEKDFQTVSQFLKHQIINKQQQICLVSIEEFDKYLRELSEEDLEKIVRDNKRRITNFLRNQYKQYSFNFYKYDTSNFFFTVDEKLNDSVFEEIIRTLQTYCGNDSLFKDEITYYNHFTFTLDGLAIQQLFEATKRTDLPLEKQRFNHCDIEIVENNNLHEEFKMVAALNEIIKSNAIVPYFQGIYDNKKNRFHMYEALMRLQHPDGQMLFPADFMDIAKKYELYLPLSLCMVKKVFELFSDRDETITINISAYDILSDTFKTTVFEYMRTLPNPQNFVFELLETEAFSDLGALRDFIYQVKQYGCKIAVDDFGAGYSNFIEFGNLDVDYLKINGSLTKLLGTDFSYSHILNSIAFMGEKMKVELIAEFVETASTQKLLIQSGVHYSQGYFFSKPMPFSELVVVSEENIRKSIEQEEESEEGKGGTFTRNHAIKDNIILYIGGLLVALLTVFSVSYFVSYNQNEFKKINDSFLVEIATGISDKVALFAEESKISLTIMSVAMSEYTNTLIGEYNFAEELLALSEATKFNAAYISFGGSPAIDGYGNVLPIPIEEMYGRASGEGVAILPMFTDAEGNSHLIFSACLIRDGRKVGEIYGTYNVEDIADLLNLRSFGGEAFYHISQVDGVPIHLSGRQENAFTSGDMYDFIGSLDIFNGHTAESIEQDMVEGNTVLLNYYLNDEERSAVMVRIPDTEWCVVSIVLNEINIQMLQTSRRSTLYFIAFVIAVYAMYFMFVARIFRNHRNIILETLEASQSLSNSLQLSIEKDSLTGTYSRATAIEKISNIISTQTSKGVVHALAILDIDNFKYINDTYGHHTGDMYLQSFVSAVKLGIKPGNVLGRLGGDEFLLLLNDIEDSKQVSESFDKIFTNIRAISLGGVDLECVSVSAGIVMITENDRTYEDLMVEADNTLYKAKREGKNKYLFAE